MGSDPSQLANAKFMILSSLVFVIIAGVMYYLRLEHADGEHVYDGMEAERRFWYLFIFNIRFQNFKFTRKVERLYVTISK